MSKAQAPYKPDPLIVKICERNEATARQVEAERQARRAEEARLNQVVGTIRVSAPLTVRLEEQLEKAAKILGVSVETVLANHMQVQVNWSAITWNEYKKALEAI